MPTDAPGPPRTRSNSTEGRRCPRSRGLRLRPVRRLTPVAGHNPHTSKEVCSRSIPPIRTERPARSRSTPVTCYGSSPCTGPCSVDEAASSLLKQQATLRRSRGELTRSDSTRRRRRCSCQRGLAGLVRDGTGDQAHPRRGTSCGERSLRAVGKKIRQHAPSARHIPSFSTMDLASMSSPAGGSMTRDPAGSACEVRKAGVACGGRAYTIRGRVLQSRHDERG